MRRLGIVAVGLALLVTYGAAAVLASPHADCITGPAVNLDGGPLRKRL